MFQLSYLNHTGAGVGCWLMGFEKRVFEGSVTEFFIKLCICVRCRYTQYTVTLAHNVICSWYVNCPLLLRKQFVSFITKVCL